MTTISDHRDQMNALAREVADKVFPNEIEFERACAKAPKLFSINAIVAAVKTVCEAWYGDEEPVEADVIAFFRTVREAMKSEFNPAAKLVDVFGSSDEENEPLTIGGVEIKPQSGSQRDRPAIGDSMARQNIALEAIAIALAPQKGWKAMAKKLPELDWSREAEQWERCHVVVDGRILKNRKTTQAMGMSISRALT